MLEYTEVSRNRRKLLALTGLTVKEFRLLLPAFDEAYRQATTRAKQAERVRRLGGGRRGQLASIEQKLLFILVYQKTYPLQVVLGELFGMGQSAANQWIHRLLPVLRDALDTLGVKPERDGSQFARTVAARDESPDYIIDGTERRRQRPKDPEKQARYYSGKKKAHSDKNIVIVHTRTKRVGYLSPTYPGKTHDKKLADSEQIAYPAKAILHKDTGFQGYEPSVKETRQPKKSRASKN